MTIKGFFNLKALKSVNTTDDNNCEKCSLYKEVKSPNMPVHGKGSLKTLFIAEAPGSSEDLQGKQLVGGAGQLLQKNLKRLDLDLEEHFWRINCVNCRPTTKEGKNRPPTKKEVQYCRPKWKSVIQKLKPTHIVLAGGKAVEAYFGDRKNPLFTKDLSISRWRGLCIPDQENDCWVIPIIHPSFPQYNQLMEEIFFKDLKWMASCLGKERPNFDINYKVRVTDNLEEILDFLKHLHNQSAFAYDFETTALKPYHEKSKILSIGIAFKEEVGLSFPYDYKNMWSKEELSQITAAFKSVLENPNIEKIVQNRSMEENWSRVFFCEPKNISWDTQLASHIIDERDNFTSLKFQSFINWGIVDYDKEVNAFKSSTNESPYNRMEEVPWPSLCKYNGEDAIFTFKLRNLQKTKLRQPDLKRANDFLQKGNAVLTKMTYRGIDTDKSYFIKEYNNLEKEMNKLKKEILTTEEVLLFEKKTGQSFDMQSSLHLRKLLFGKDFMNLGSTKQTTTGLDSVDADTLERLDIPFAKKIVKIRKTKKIQDYLGLIAKTTNADKIHPYFDLHLARTGRSSSSSPNLQNFPKRDEYANKLIRSGILAPPDWQLLATDFGAMEVRGFAWYSKDPTLVHELTNGMDPHGVWAEFLGCSRFDAKNAFVFPLIYGSYHKNIHRELQLRGYEKISLERCQQAENKFWDKYHHAKEWQERLLHNYYKTGYVDSFFGFRRRGIISRNQAVNFPIQATCFHCLVWSFNRLDEISQKEGWKSYQIGQIHDENLFKLWPEEFAHVGKTIERVMVDELIAEFDWINVPPLAEVSLSKIGGSWSSMSDFTKAHNGKNPFHLYEGKSWEGE